MESLEISPETADSSLDDLMWNTAVMLQIFITELEKVEVLTEAFAFKYKAGLKCRLSHTNMCGAPIDSDDDFVTDRDDDPVATLTTPEGTVVVKVPESNLSSREFEMHFIQLVLLIGFSHTVSASCLYMQKLNFIGGTFEEFTTADKIACCIACSNERCCLAYSFHRETHKCYLKSSFGYSVEDDQYVSGLNANVNYGKAVRLRNVKITGGKGDPVRLESESECRMFCSAFNIYSWYKTNEEKGMCSCLRRVVGLQYKHGHTAYISPGVDNKF
ncbi:unnamed protein product [Auanema sp. JU1783]|nr:unnamed protein product [Auanema sp. JU1783]